MFYKDFQTNANKDDSTQNFNFKMKSFAEMHTDKHPSECKQKTDESNYKYGFPYCS